MFECLAFVSLSTRFVVVWQTMRDGNIHYEYNHTHWVIKYQKRFVEMRMKERDGDIQDDANEFGDIAKDENEAAKEE